MSKKLYISDWHYGHKNVIGYDNRPFANVDQMNEELIHRWNSVVSDSDTVYVLGDMFWCTPAKAIPILKSLNGNIVLIKGNHDRIDNAGFRNQFTDIVDYAEIHDFYKGIERNIVLCHYPVPCFKNHTHGWIHLYGHVHNSEEWSMVERWGDELSASYGKTHEMVNVGAMMPYIDYAPRTLEEIVDGHHQFKGGIFVGI